MHISRGGGRERHRRVLLVVHDVEQENASSFDSSIRNLLRRVHLGLAKRHIFADWGNVSLVASTCSIGYSTGVVLSCEN